jgi:hypothetical protein
MVRDAKAEAKQQQVLFALEIEFGRKGKDYSRDFILKKYVQTPLMDKYLQGKLKKNLAEVVEMIELGDAGVAAGKKSLKEERAKEAYV